MVEQAQAGKCHHHAVFVAGLDDGRVGHASTGLHNIIYSVLGRMINTVAEREKGVRGQADTVQIVQPLTLGLPIEKLRHRIEQRLPLPQFIGGEIALNVTHLVEGASARFERFINKEMYRVLNLF